MISGRSYAFGREVSLIYDFGLWIRKLSTTAAEKRSYAVKSRNGAILL
jgi:hypothetical protein